MSKAKKIFFWTLGIIVVINVIITLSGNTHLYKGIKYTYLEGEKGPTIYDLEKFSRDTILKSNASPFYSYSEKLDTILTPRLIELADSLETSSFVILRGDTVIAEKYFGGHTSDEVSNSFSMAKSFVSILIGVAVREGKITSIDDSLSKYIPEWENQPRGNVTLRQVLTMSSGLKWSESGANPFSDNAKAYYGNHLNALVDKEMRIVGVPGAEFNYKSGNTQILVMALENATGTSLASYAEEQLWSKIQSQNDAYWSKDNATGNAKGYCCYYATPKDFAAIGKLILNKGVWGGDTIIPQEYYEALTTPALYSDDSADCYGLQIWLVPKEEVIYARGILGQYIIVDKKNDLIIVRTGSKRKAKKDGYHPDELYEYLEESRKINQGVK